MIRRDRVAEDRERSRATNLRKRAGFQFEVHEERRPDVAGFLFSFVCFVSFVLFVVQLSRRRFGDVLFAVLSAGPRVHGRKHISLVAAPPVEWKSRELSGKTVGDRTAT